MTAALKFESVSKTFVRKGQRTDALKNVSFSINEGEAFGFIGPNGAGKSTTIKILLDIISDYQGAAHLYGVSTRDALSRKGIAYVPESPALYDELTPLEIMKMALHMYGIKRDNPEKWCLQWLESLSLGHAARRRIRQLSKGTVQRVALAHALVVSPRMLILDEPLSGLDPVGRKDVVDILRRYKEEGGTIFFTSHVLYDVERIADRFGLIIQGELMTTREPRDLLNEHTDSFVVRYQAVHPEKLGGNLSYKEVYELELPQEKLGAWLQQLNLQHGRLIEIKPAISLETVFFRMIGQYGKSNKPESLIGKAVGYDD